jgi:hypothetical protein
MKALQSGCLKELLAAVKSDDELCLEIRKDYINIYYRGGNLCRVKQQESAYIFYFDPKYALDESDRKLVIDLNEKTMKPETWVKNIPKIKRIMDKWFALKHPQKEREFQQHIVRDNISGVTDYIVVDIEYANSENKSRFDVLALKPLPGDTENQVSKFLPVFIEIKYEDGALSGDSGIKEHFKDMYNFLKDENLRVAVYEDMNAILNQKIELGLLPYINPDSIELDTENKPEFILLIAGHNPKSTILKRELNELARKIPCEFSSIIEAAIVLRQPKYALEEFCDIKIALTAIDEYKLYAKNMIPIEDF